MKPLVACAIALCTALPLHAETYKWVDEKGVTNYSSTPPPAGKNSKVKVIEDRVSVIPTDPDLGRQAAALQAREARRSQYAEADWARRQQMMPSMQPAYYDGSSDYPYYADYGWYGGYGAYYTTYRPFFFAAAAARHNRPHPQPLHGATRPAHPIAHGGMRATRGGMPLR